MKLHAIDFAASAVHVGAVQFSGNILNGGAAVRVADLKRAHIMGMELDANTLPDGDVLVIRRRQDGSFTLAR